MCLRYNQNKRSNQQFVSETKTLVVLMKVLKMPHRSTQTCWNAVTQTLALCFIRTIYTLQSQVLHPWWLSNYRPMMMMIAYSFIYQHRVPMQMIWIFINPIFMDSSIPSNLPSQWLQGR